MTRTEARNLHGRMASHYGIEAARFLADNGPWSGENAANSAFMAGHHAGIVQRMNDEDIIRIERRRGGRIGSMPE